MSRAGECTHKTAEDHTFPMRDGERRRWRCTVCGRVDAWGEAWGYHGNMECSKCWVAAIDGVYCSEPCKRKLKAVLRAEGKKIRAAEAEREREPEPVRNRIDFVTNEADERFWVAQFEAMQEPVIRFVFDFTGTNDGDDEDPSFEGERWLSHHDAARLHAWLGAVLTLGELAAEPEDSSAGEPPP